MTGKIKRKGLFRYGIRINWKNSLSINQCGNFAPYSIRMMYKNNGLNSYEFGIIFRFNRYGNGRWAHPPIDIFVLPVL